MDIDHASLAVACDVLEEQGHWPLGAAAMPLLHDRGNDPATVEWTFPLDLYPPYAHHSDEGQFPDYEPEVCSIDTQPDADGTGRDDMCGELDGNGGDFYVAGMLFPDDYR